MTMTASTDTAAAPGINASDMSQLAELATLLSAARDALTDDIVIRLASAFSEGMVLLDRLTRNEGLIHLLRELERPENQRFLIAMANAFTEASRDLAVKPPARGGIGCLLRTASDPGVLEGLRLMSLVGAHLSQSLRDMHHKGG
jgi:hypothetical protein